MSISERCPAHATQGCSVYTPCMKYSSDGEINEPFKFNGDRMNHDTTAGRGVRYRCGGWRYAFAIASLTTCALAGAQVATQADLSMLSEFGVSDIVGSIYRIGPIAGIKQEGGSDNLAYVEQSGGSNMAQVWQQGNNNIAKVVQDGGMNTVRLWQEGDGHSANIYQSGWDNQIAAVQVGFGSTLEGTQIGNGNTAALVLNSDSKFTFLQKNDNNSIVATMLVAAKPTSIVQNGDQQLSIVFK